LKRKGRSKITKTCFCFEAKGLKIAKKIKAKQTEMKQKRLASFCFEAKIKKERKRHTLTGGKSVIGD
jgi:hypothetical protein